MNRYLLFATYTYYPLGGLNDLLCMSDDIEECKRHIANELFDVADIYDTQCNKIILRYSSCDRTWRDVNVDIIEIIKKNNDDL